jgi:hypothetical protein
MVQSVGPEFKLQYRKKKRGNHWKIKSLMVHFQGKTFNLEWKVTGSLLA